MNTCARCAPHAEQRIRGITSAMRVFLPMSRASATTTSPSQWSDSRVWEVTGMATRKS